MHYLPSDQTLKKIRVKLVLVFPQISSCKSAFDTLWKKLFQIFFFFCFMDTSRTLQGHFKMSAYKFLLLVFIHFLQNWLGELDYTTKQKLELSRVQIENGLYTADVVLQQLSLLFISLSDSFTAHIFNEHFLQQIIGMVRK